jgi:hypothetical protein
MSHPHPAQEMMYWPVSARVSKVTAMGPEEGTAPGLGGGIPAPLCTQGLERWGNAKPGG